MVSERHAPVGDHRSLLERVARQAMLERGLEPDFSPAVERELESSVPRPPHGADLRGLPWVSIDNDDSRDLDQLTCVEELSAGGHRVLVAIADVASSVRAGGAIDAHAAHNTTSVYTVPRVFPMLPVQLSNDRTSLGEDAARAALVVEIDLDARGRTSAGRVRAARVQNRAKLAYDPVERWLEERAPAPGRLARDAALARQVRLQDELAQTVKELRFAAGALEFDTRTPHPRYENGQVTALVERDRNRATELIENFMILANGVVARELGARGPFLMRVVRKPRNWNRLRQVARERGFELPMEPDGKALATFLAQRRAADPRGFRELSLVVVKLVGAGEYAVGGAGREPPGHFGLALRDYTHATAPNRRFSDLVTQRLLLALAHERESPYAEADLEAIARNCTKRESDAEKVERRVRKSAAALFLSGRTGERFGAIVTGASEKGVFVRIEAPPVEGMLRRPEPGIEVGQRLRVELLDVDVEQGHIDFQPV